MEAYPRHITQAARDRLLKAPYRAVRNVACEFRNGTLFLRGRLPNFHHKQIAQEAVAGLPGVVQVINETEVAVA